MLDTMRYESPIGELVLVQKNEALVELWIAGQKYFPDFRQKEIKEHADSRILNQTKEWLDRYFRGEKPLIRELKLAPEGSEFQRAVWKLLCGIPCGEVTTYGELSRRIAADRGLERMSAQAVGGAVSHNPISIIIPCHRVVGADGSLTGYAGGLDRKVRLLEMEGVDMKNLFVPATGAGAVRNRT